jgi:hypothetical protein
METRRGKLMRSRSIVLIAWLFIAVGAVGLLNDLLPLLTDTTRQMAKLKSDGWADLGPAWTSRTLAIVGGVGLLGGHNWARWLLAAWMVFHIGLSAAHSRSQLLVHVIIFAPILFFLFRRRGRIFAARP